MQRSWTAGAEDPDSWNPKLRAPICFTALAAQRSYWPIVFKKTELVLAGVSKAQMFENIKSSFDKKDLPTMEFGSMCYMMSWDQYLIIESVVMDLLDTKVRRRIVQGRVGVDRLRSVWIADIQADHVIESTGQERPALR